MPETTNSTASSNGINTITKFAYGATGFTGQCTAYISGGFVIEADIEINTSHAWANSAQPNKYDIQSTMTHEFGHVIRVNHSSTYANTMYHTGSQNTTYKRSVTSDDVDAANDSYDRWN